MADMNTLLPVIVGGVIGIAGGLVGPPIVHWLQASERQKKLRAEKFEELHAAVFEVPNWLNTIRDSKFFGTPGTIGVSPVSKAHAIASIYFPESLNAVNVLSKTTQDHVAWIANAALKKVENPNGFADDLPTSYQPVMDAMNNLIAELNVIARREFRSKH